MAYVFLFVAGFILVSVSMFTFGFYFRGWIDPSTNERKYQQAISMLDEGHGDLLHWAWAIICNASGGDWTREKPEWQDASARFRESYHAWLDERKAVLGDPYAVPQEASGR